MGRGGIGVEEDTSDAEEIKSRETFRGRGLVLLLRCGYLEKAARPFEVKRSTTTSV